MIIIWHFCGHWKKSECTNLKILSWFLYSLQIISISSSMTKGVKGKDKNLECDKDKEEIRSSMLSWCTTSGWRNKYKCKRKYWKRLWKHPSASSVEEESITWFLWHSSPSEASSRENCWREQVPVVKDKSVFLIRIVMEMLNFYFDAGNRSYGLNNAYSLATDIIFAKDRLWWYSNPRAIDN